MMKLNRLNLAMLTLFSMPAMATDWVTTINPGDNYSGSNGTITFNDWGYTGPTGVGANDFQVGSGFDAGRIGQIQQVVTTAPDWLTPDPVDNNVVTDFGAIGYPPNTSLPNANMDGQVNFYQWGYTTPAGSTFSNMQIDKAGNYHIAKNDMSFGFYDTFSYNNGGTVTDVDTGLNFQPYAVSDAQGWCGSVLVENPNGLEVMAGQVKFDFAFDVYFSDGGPGDYFNTIIVPEFVMRSYGDYDVNINTGGGTNQHFIGSAVGNNVNPDTGVLDPDFQNQVSFLGAGVVPASVWVLNAGTPDVQVVPEGTQGATLHINSFAGYAFLLRADAERTLEFISPTGHSDYVRTAHTPVPAAVWLFGSGLIGLIGFARRRTNT